MKRFTEPPFWEDILEEKEEPFFNSLIDNFDVIEKEILRLYKLSKFLKFFWKYPVQKSDLKLSNWWFIEESTRWTVAPVFGGKNDALVRRRAKKFFLIASEPLSFLVRFLCPQMSKILKFYFDKKILLNSTINIIYPGSVIGPHIHPVFDHKHRMNYHLCITEDPAAELTVGYETKTWKKGKIVAFKNSGPYRHSVVHKGKDIRIILMAEIDVDYLKSYGVYRGQRIKD